MSIFTTSIGWLSITTLLFYLHPIHVSVTEIEFDEKDKALEIMMRVFIDDLELTLQKKTNQPDLDIYEKDSAMVDQLVRSYLKDHFRISLDNKPQKVTYIGHERESEAFIFYIEVVNVKKWKTIQVFNDIITETHNDQSNLVHVTVNEKVRSLRLTKDTPVNQLTFDTK
jgi:hypothetical protein